MDAPGPALHDARPERLMVIVAHPDDAGADDAATDPLQLARLREDEQRAAARVVGYETVHFLHRPDGALANDLPLRQELVRLIRSFRPDAGMAAVDAVYPTARNPMAFPELYREGLTAHTVSRLFLFFTDVPEVWVDIS